MFSRDISGCLGSKISMAIMDSHGCCHKQIHGYQWHGWQSIGGNGYLHINCYRWLSMPPLPRPVATRFFGSTDWVCVPSSTFHWIHGNAKRIWQPRLAKPPFSLFGLECPPRQFLQPKLLHQKQQDIHWEMRISPKNAALSELSFAFHSYWANQ